MRIFIQLSRCLRECGWQCARRHGRSRAPILGTLAIRSSSCWRPICCRSVPRLRRTPPSLVGSGNDAPRATRTRRAICTSYAPRDGYVAWTLYGANNEQLTAQNDAEQLLYLTNGKLSRDYNCDSTTIRLRSDYDVSRAPASIRRDSTRAKNEHVNFSS